MFLILAGNKYNHKNLDESFDILWLSTLPAKMKKIQSKMKALECQQNYMSFFSDAQGKLTLKSVVEFCRNSNFGPIRPGTAELSAL